MNNFRNYYETQLNTKSKSEVFKKFVPKDFYDGILEIDNKVYFRIDIVCNYLVFLKKESIIKKRKCKIINNKQYVDTTSIDEILVDCSKRDNKFRTIDINKELGRIKVKENKIFKKKLGTSLYEVQDYGLSIKYTKEARFLYAVDKYLKYLKHETKEKVFLNDIKLVHPQYKDMKNNFRYDLYIPSAKICIEYLEEYHNNKEKTEQDIIRKQVIEYEDVLVMSYNYSQTDEDADIYLANFLLNLKDNIVDRSLYFTNDEITTDQYLYVFQKNGISDINIARKMLEIRNKNYKEIDIPLVDAFDMILLRKDDYDKALDLISNSLKKNVQYKYDNEFIIENINLNKTGFCDFCVLIATEKSRQILEYYREVEAMCINMIKKEKEYMKEQAEKKEKFQKIRDKLKEDNLHLQLQFDYNTMKRKYNDFVKSSKEELQFYKKRNKEQKNALVKIKKIIDDVNLTDHSFRNQTNKLLQNFKFLEKNNDIVILKDQEPVFPQLNCLVYVEENDINPVYLSDLVNKYNQYNSTKLTKKNIIEMLEKFNDKIQIIRSSSFAGKSNKEKLTNVRWLSDNELNESDTEDEDSDDESNTEDEDSDDESNTEISLSLSQVKLTDTDSEFELDLDQD